MNTINGHQYNPEVVPASIKFLALIANSDFDVLDDFHPGVPGSMTLVDRETNSALTLLVFETDDGEDV